MAFSIVYGTGSLMYTEARENMAIQFPESIIALCPQCDLVLLKQVDPKVLYALGSEFNVCESPFGCVATKWRLCNWAFNRENMCRFDIHNKVTVTFGCYDTLYSFEKDFAALLTPPTHRQHFICIIIRRTVNWKTMVHMCSVFQIQYPTYKASQCCDQNDIVLMGWQRFSNVLFSSQLEIVDTLKLPIPLPSNECCNTITSYNHDPFYIARYVMGKFSNQGLKKMPKRVFKNNETSEQCSTKMGQEVSAPLENKCDSKPNGALEIKPNNTFDNKEADEANPFFIEPVHAEKKETLPRSRHVSKPSEDGIEDWVLTTITVEE